MSRFQSFLGRWEMIPEKNNYEVGNAPIEGTYIISLVDGDILRFDMAWKDVNHQQHNAFYEVNADGDMHPYEDIAIAEHVKTTLLSPTQLESRVYKDGEEVAYSIRELVDDNYLYINQIGMLTDGSKFSNKSIYKRV